MVMNEKILANKFEKISKILNEDGGMTMIEIMGLLRYVEIRLVDEAYNKTLQNLQEHSKNYEQLRKKRVGDLNQ